MAHPKTLVTIQFQVSKADTLDLCHALFAITEIFESRDPNLLHHVYTARQTSLAIENREIRTFTEESLKDVLRRIKNG